VRLPTPTRVWDASIGVPRRSPSHPATESHLVRCHRLRSDLHHCPRHCLGPSGTRSGLFQPKTQTPRLHSAGLHPAILHRGSRTIDTPPRHCGCGSNWKPKSGWAPLQCFRARVRMPARATAATVQQPAWYERGNRTEPPGMRWHSIWLVLLRASGAGR
jgi:hypothetical protein